MPMKGLVVGDPEHVRPNPSECNDSNPLAPAFVSRRHVGELDPRGPRCENGVRHPYIALRNVRQLNDAVALIHGVHAVRIVLEATTLAWASVSLCTPTPVARLRRWSLEMEASDFWHGCSWRW